jgi:hypothetical protein
MTDDSLATPSSVDSTQATVEDVQQRRQATSTGGTWVGASAIIAILLAYVIHAIPITASSTVLFLLGLLVGSIFGLLLAGVLAWRFYVRKAAVSTSDSIRRSKFRRSAPRD